MIGEKVVLGVVPARGGSKGLPKKNIRELCGQPLLGWTLDKAQSSKFLDEVYVSTDSQEIADIAISLGGNVPFFRPPTLATDSASSVDVVVHAMEYFTRVNGTPPDIVILLEPTSPLREPQDIDTIIRTLAESYSNLDGVISIGEASSHPDLVKRTRNNLVHPFFENSFSEARRQDLQAAYFPYGVGYAVKASYLQAYRSFYPARCGFHLIQKYQCYEIDDIYDHLCVEAILKHKLETI